jgi:predicted deacylase
MSEISDCFSGNYAQARQAFREAAQGAGAALGSYHNPATGPGGISLSTETARLGAAEAERLLIAISGTHGVECFCGSGLQVGLLRSGIAAEIARGGALLLVHAINPSGFAWVRRVNEDNVDLNRNFVDHSRPHPVNAGYDELREAICPRDWINGRAAADAMLEAYRRSHGMAALQTAISSGQYGDPAGVFYGGREPVWSNRTLREILRREAGKARHVAYIDLHTGLGSYGTGEIMSNHRAAYPGFRRVKDWFGSEATSDDEGSAASAPVSGDTNGALIEELPQAAVTGITLEYGTVALKPMFDAIRADNWLHLHGQLDSPEGRAIKAQIRQAFYPDENDWRRMVWERAVDVIRRMAQGLKGS